MMSVEVDVDAVVIIRYIGGSRLDVGGIYMLEMIRALFWNLIFIYRILIKLPLIRVVVSSVMLVNGIEIWMSTRSPC